MSPRLFLQF